MIRQTTLETKNPLNYLNSDLNLTKKEPEYQNIADEKLAALYVNDKDDGAFTELVNRYGDKIFRLAMRITKSPQAAEEVLQSVFVKLVEKLATFRQESKLSTWIYTISTKECFRYLRRRNNSKETSLEELSEREDGTSSVGLQIKSDDYDPENSAINLEISELLDKAVNELEHEYRTVFQLRDVEGLSNSEVAEVLGLSVPAVKSRILRARTQLKNKLSKSFSKNNLI